MASYTSNANGNWSDAAIWTPSGGPPGAGDTATVDHTIVVHVDTIVGDGSDTTVLAVSTTSSSITVAAGIGFTIRGNGAWGAYNGHVMRAYLAIEAGGSVALDSATGPIQTWTYDSAVFINGTSDARCSVNGLGGTGANGRFVDDETGCNLNTTATCCDFSNLGDASHNGWGYCYLYAVAGQVASFANCTFTGCAQAPYPLVEIDSAVISLTNCTWTDPLASPIGLLCELANSGGTRLIQDCAFLGTFEVNLSSQQDFTITGNYFGANLYSQGEAASWAGFSGNFLRQPVVAERQFAGDVTVNYFFADAGGGGSFVLVSDFQDFAISGNVFDPLLVTNYGYAVGLTEASTNPRPDSSVSGNLLLPSSAGNPWTLLAATTNSAAPNALQVAVIGNTAFVQGTAGAVDITPVLPDRERAGSLLAVRDNLFVATGSPTAFAVANTGAIGSGVVADVVTGADCHHNAYSSLATTPSGTWTGVSGDTGVENGTVYNTPMSGSTVPGANDVNLGMITDPATQGPMFVDPTRNFSTWATANYGSVAAALLAIQADVVGANTLISDLMSWVQAGYAPTNPALATSSSTGSTNGAIPYQSSGASAYTLVAPTPAKGDVNVPSGNFTVTPNAAFTVTPNAAFTGTITPHTTGTGTFSPTSLTFSASSAPQTFTYTSITAGVADTIGTTNSGGLADPSSVTYLGMVQFGHSGTNSTTGGAAGGNVPPSFGGSSLLSVGPYFAEFTRDISGEPLDPNSAAIMALFTGSPNVHVDFSSTAAGTTSPGYYGIPYNVVAGTQSTSPIPIRTPTRSMPGARSRSPSRPRSNPPSPRTTRPRTCRRETGTCWSACETRRPA